MYLLKENAKPVSINKKRRKVDLLQLPGQPDHLNAKPSDEKSFMMVDEDANEESSAMKWPGKRG